MRRLRSEPVCVSRPDPMFSTKPRRSYDADEDAYERIANLEERTRRVESRLNRADLLTTRFG